MTRFSGLHKPENIFSSIKILAIAKIYVVTQQTVSMESRLVVKEIVGCQIRHRPLTDTFFMDSCKSKFSFISSKLMKFYRGI